MSASGERHEAPVELRFIDLFMIVIACLVLIAVPLLLRGMGRDRPPQILSKSVPAAMRSERYGLTLAAAGGAPPLTWRVARGALPAGLELRDGTIEGTPVEAGTRRLVLELEDARGARDRAAVELLVLDFLLPEQKRRQLAVEVEEVVLADAAHGERYAVQLTARGGVLPHRWAAAGGRLPPGLALEATGRLAGAARGEDVPLLWKLFALKSARARWLRESNTHRFEAVVTDRAGQSRRQGVTVFVEPPPRPFLVQIFLGEYSTPVRWPWRVLSWVLTVLWVVAVGLVLLIAVIPWCLFLFGFAAQEIQGWPGLLWRPGQGSGGTVDPVWASLALVARGILTALVNLRHLRFPEPQYGGGGGGGGGGFTEEEEEDGDPAPDLPIPLPTGTALPASPGARAVAVQQDEGYLDDLRRGGVVKHGGAFLGLAFVRRAGLGGEVGEAFRPLPDVGQGLLHASLDRFFRHLLALRPARGGFGRLDARFDVVLGRAGPATPGVRPVLGRLALPAGLDPDARRVARLEDVLGAVSELDQRRLKACGISVREPALRRIVLGGAAEQLDATMAAAAGQARRWLANLASGAGEPVRKRTLFRILRAPAHVHLEGGALHVRLLLARDRDRPAAEALCWRLNALGTRMLPPHEVPVRFGVR
jgi:hypothetical protein